MNILDKMKSMVGIGKPDMAFGDLHGPFRAGQPLRGTLLLRGGEYDAPVRDVVIHLDEQRVVYTAPATPDRQFWRRISAVEIVMDGRILRSEEVLELPFELLLPVDLAPSEGNVRYQLVAETEVPGLNPTTELPVLIEP